MFERLMKALRAMELEEKILHAGLLLSLLGLFLPWLTVGSYGETAVMSNAFSFRTGFIGHAVLLINIFILVMTASPLVGGPVLVRKSRRNTARLLFTALATALVLGAFSVLVRVTFEISGAEIRFGVYVSLVGAALATLYSFLRYQEQKRSEVHDLFRHPDEPVPQRTPPTAPEVEHSPPLPPPPPPPPAEDHKLYSQ